MIGDCLLFSVISGFTLAVLRLALSVALDMLDYAHPWIVTLSQIP